MSHHLEAWEHVRKHLFGEVVEVARRVPWGFLEDKGDIINVTVDDYLKKPMQTDTIVLHILSGEGEPMETVEKVVTKALGECVKLVILEHNPDEWNVPSLEPIQKLLPDHINDNWGRNLLFACTTTRYLHLPQLSDDYLAEHLNLTYVTSEDEGIDTTNLVYTHTSETPIDFPLPDGTIYWVIGGGIAYESMEKKNTNILIDSVLRQVLVAAYLYDEQWKVKRIWNDVDAIETAPDYKQWRLVTPNGIPPTRIEHAALKDLDVQNATIYVSTVHKDHWKHLTKDNNILDAWTNRDIIQLCNR